MSNRRKEDTEISRGFGMGVLSFELVVPSPPEFSGLGTQFCK